MCVQKIGDGAIITTEGTEFTGKLSNSVFPLSFAAKVFCTVSRPPLISGVYFFYEKVINVKADVAALLLFDLRHISAEKFALGSRSGTTIGNSVDPTVPPVLSVLP
jgi:hypothetical protein